MKSLQVELRSVKSFCVYRSEIPASVATSHGSNSGSAKPSLMMPRIRANSLSAWRETGHDFVGHSNPHEPKQFYWVDDAFGETRLDWQAALQWNGAFPHVRAAIRRGTKFVFTSRDYIYRNA